MSDTKSVSHSPVRVSKQMESAMGKDGLSPLQIDSGSVEHERSRY